MPVSLDVLAKTIDPARTILLLGAGAAVPSGAPTGAQLAAALIKQLAPAVRADLPLPTIAEILEAKVGRARVVGALEDILLELRPTGGLASMPVYDWRSVYSTNFDMLVERAYAAAGRPLNVVRSNFDFGAAANASGTTLYKIHGCIGQDRSKGHHASLVLTESDYRDFKKYRQFLFGRLLNDMAANRVMIIGQSLADPHLKDLVFEVAALQKELSVRDRVVLVSYERDEDLASIFELREVTVAFGGIDELAEALCRVSSVAATADPVVPPGSLVPLPVDLLPSTLVVSHAKAGTPRVDWMFGGAPATYADIESGLTFQRDAEVQAIGRLQAGQYVVTLKGVAGNGKTTAARRIAHALEGLGWGAWEHRHEFPLRTDAWLAVEAELRGRSLCGVLVLDNVTRNQRAANDLLNALARIPNPALRLVTTAELSQWNPRQKSKYFFAQGEPILMKQLSGLEINALLTLAERDGGVRSLITPNFLRLSRVDRRAHLERRCSADMFVCLKNIFGKSSLDEIVVREFNELPNEDMKQIYRHVAALEAAGLDVHRQLVIKCLDLDHESILAVFRELEGLVEEDDLSVQDGIYLWRTRHRTVAEIITRYKYADQRELIRLLERVIQELNPAVRVELRGVTELCVSPGGIRALTDPTERTRLFRMLTEVAPRERVPWQHLARAYLDCDDVIAAEATIEQAEQLAGRDPPLAYLGIRCLLYRARNARGLVASDRIALVRQARTSALKGIDRYSTNKHMYYAFDSAAREYFDLTEDPTWLHESAARLDYAYKELLDPEIREQLVSTQRLASRR